MSNRPPPDERPHIWDKPENVNRFLTVFYLLCVLLVVLDFVVMVVPDSVLLVVPGFVVRREVHHPWEGFVGFHAFYGFVACWTLVVVAKAMRRILMRREDYYDVD